MLNFLLLMIVPTVVSLGALLWFRKKVTLGECGIQMGVVAFFIVICLGVAYWQNTTDTEIWNGEIRDKQKVRVSCEHSYPCNCRTECSGSGNNRTCSTVCDTCYEHAYDFDWRIWATTGDTVNIGRVDRQGNDMPPRWGSAYLGEPFSSSHSYTNYILANPESVLLGGKGDVQRFASLIPSYPTTIYDYYRYDHVINMGVPNVDLKTWNWLINQTNKRLGPAKQVNVMVLLVNTDDPKYVLALKDKWIGGKKNDAVVVIASKDGRKVEFADVVSWTPSASYKIELRDRIMEIGDLAQKDEITKAIADITATRFQRMHMKDYKYLMRSFQPSTTAMWIIFILATLASVGISVWTVMNDITDEVPTYSSYNRYRSYRSSY